MQIQPGKDGFKIENDDMFTNRMGAIDEDEPLPPGILPDTLQYKEYEKSRYEAKEQEFNPNLNFGFPGLIVTNVMRQSNLSIDDSPQNSDAHSQEGKRGQMRGEHEELPQKGK